MLKNFLSSLSGVSIAYFLFFVTPSILVSVANMYLLHLVPIDISSSIGSYVGVIIAFGMLTRCYVSGFSNGVSDYAEEDADKSIYVMLGNVFIIVGFMLLIGNWIEAFILSPIVAYHIIMGIRSADGNFLFGEKGPWSASKCWRRELRVVVFVSILTILVQIIGFENGAAIPVVALR